MKTQVINHFQSLLQADLCWGEAMKQTIQEFNINQDIFSMMVESNELVQL